MSCARRLPRAVIDTNLVLSALVFAQGRLTPLRQAWQYGRCRPLVSKATVAELMRVSDYLPWCTTVHVSDVPFEMPLCRDPFDLPFLQLATAGKADYLVTGDADLLCLSDQFVPPIITADDFMKMLDG